MSAENNDMQTTPPDNPAGVPTSNVDASALSLANAGGSQDTNVSPEPSSPAKKARRASTIKRGDTECRLCDEVFPTWGALRDHVYDEHDFGYKCVVEGCKYKCSQKRRLQDHYADKHPELFDVKSHDSQDHEGDGDVERSLGGGNGNGGGGGVALAVGLDQPEYNHPGQQQQQQPVQNVPVPGVVQQHEGQGVALAHNHQLAAILAQHQAALVQQKVALDQLQQNLAMAQQHQHQQWAAVVQQQQHGFEPISNINRSVGHRLQPYGPQEQQHQQAEALQQLKQETGLAGQDRFYDLLDQAKNEYVRLGSNSEKARENFIFQINRLREENSNLTSTLAKAMDLVAKEREKAA